MNNSRDDFQRCPGNSPFCLGMVEYDCCGTGKRNTDENAEDLEWQQVKKPRPASRKKKAALSPSSRFNKTCNEAEITKSSKGVVPSTTARSTSWACRVFQGWLTQRNERNKEKFPIDLFDKPHPVEIISSCLQRFVLEARREDGTRYPPKTIYQLLSGLLQYSKEVQSTPVNFLDRGDRRFKALHNTCDSEFRSLHDDGIGTERKSAGILTNEDENILWDSGVLSTKTPDGLQKAVFYYVGKVCCLRGGEEQRNLKLSQFTRLHNPERYIYTEHGSKNRNGGFYQLHVENKVVPIFKHPEAGCRCLVSLLDLYIEKLPPIAKTQDLFYCRSLQKYNQDSGPWYSNQPRGKHYLSEMVKNMCKEAKIEGQFTNHSLRATGATQLFRNNVPEKVIQEFTGHRSIKSLRQYEKPSMQQKMCASNVLTRCDEEGSTSGTTHSSHDVLPYKPSLPCVSSRSDNSGLCVPAYSTCNVQFPSFAPVFSNQGAVNFTVNICPSGVINHTKDDVDCDKLLDGIQLEDLL